MMTPNSNDVDPSFTNKSYTSENLYSWFGAKINFHYNDKASVNTSLWLGVKSERGGNESLDSVKYNQKLIMPGGP